MKKPRFIKGVWVGKLNNGEFLVYDPSIKNLHEYNYDANGAVDINSTIAKAFSQEARINLWVYKTQTRQFFNKFEIQEELRRNLANLRELDRQKIANAYLRWKYAATGSSDSYEYAKQKKEYEEVLEEIESENEEWLSRIKLINNGGNPNSTY